MKRMKRYWFLGVVVIMALLFAGMTFANEKPGILGKSNSINKKTGLSPIWTNLKGNKSPSPINFSDLATPVYKSHIWDRSESTPQPEGLCDPGYYDMMGETWTADTDGTTMVWAAGGNLYFADATDPTHPLEMWWGDIPIKVRIHNGIVYVFCYFGTYLLDTSGGYMGGLSVGAYYGYCDAIPSADDSYLFAFRWDFFSMGTPGDMEVYEISTFSLLYTVPPSPSGYYTAGFIPEDEHSQGKVLIAADIVNGYLDFYDISQLDVCAPQYIGTIADPYGNAGQILYKYPYLYVNYEPTWYYHPFLYWGWDDWCWISVYRLDDVSDPNNHYFIKQYEDIYDVTAMKPADTGIFVANLQGRVALFEDQFANVIKTGYFTQPSNYWIDKAVYDAGFSANGGLVADGVKGARFFDGDLRETSHFITGGFAYDVIPQGNYLYVPSGGAGLAIIDNTDPTYPITLSFFEPPGIDHLGYGFDEIYFAAISGDGNFAYVSDGTDKVWVVNISDKSHPVLLSGITTPYTTGGSPVTGLVMSGSYLLVGTTTDLQLVDVESIASMPALITSVPVAGGIYKIEGFSHSAYPGETFIGVENNGAPYNLYTFRINTQNSPPTLDPTGDTTAFPFANLLEDMTIAGEVVYVMDSTATVYPIRFIANSPAVHFTLDTTGQVPYVSTAGPQGTNFVEAISLTRLAVTNSGYMLLLLDITNPMAPTLLPTGIGGFVPVYPMNNVTALHFYNGYLYYGSDWFGTGAVTYDSTDDDLPTVTAGPLPATIYANCAPKMLEGVVPITVKVKDTTTAIKQVDFYFIDYVVGQWRRFKQIKTQTPAGVEGTYTANFDTLAWWKQTGSKDPSPIRVRVYDSACNTLVYNSVDSYGINVPPEFTVTFDAGCNHPPLSQPCESENWIVCGKLGFTVTGTDYPTNLKPDCAASNVSQIAYNIDKGTDGPWTIFSPVTSQYITIDTASLTDGPHTLYIRVTNAVGLSQMTEQTTGRSSWTFIVDNNGPSPYITAPMAGDLVKGSSIKLAAKMQDELEGKPVKKVEFYLDDPNPGDDIIGGTLIGTVTTKDEQGEYSTTWDASTFTYGDHVLVAWAYLDTACCFGPFKTPLVSFNLVQYVAMTVTATAAPTSVGIDQAVTFTAAVTGGQEPYTYAWAFGDSETGSGQVTTHSYTTAGSYSATVTVTDNTGTSVTSQPVTITVSGTPPPPPPENPVITSVKKARSPFRLHIYGSKFKPGCEVYIGTTKVPITTYKDSSHVVAKKGAALKALCPKGVQVMITVKNPDGGVSNEFPYTR